MARKNKNEDVEGAEAAPPEKEVDPASLTRLLIREFNKDEKKTGTLAWNLATDASNPTVVREFISTGSTLLDYCIANRAGGGAPVGKLMEISGEEASGKSLIIAHLIAETQRRGGTAVLIDSENALNPDFARSIGVKIEELVYLQLDTCEEVGEAIETVINKVRAKAPNRLVLIAWDSVANTPCQAELENNFDPNMNVNLEKSRFLSRMMRKLTKVWGDERIAMVFTNQLKTKIGVQYGDPMTTPGGKAIPYIASVRVRLYRGANKDASTNKDATGEEKKEKSIYGVHTRAKVIKNRLGPPLRSCEFDILFASGIDDVNSWRDKLHLLGDIVKDDGWMYLPSWPSGKIEEKGAHKGTDRGLKFREKHWEEVLKTTPGLREHVLALLDKRMVVKYGEAPPDLDIDPEGSVMEEETLAEAILASGEQ